MEVEKGVQLPTQGYMEETVLLLLPRRTKDDDDVHAEKSRQSTLCGG
jgi:hypothetical protein